MRQGNPIQKNHQARSTFVRRLVQRNDSSMLVPEGFTKNIPKRIVQFWDDLEKLPEDVAECMETWKKTECQGFERLIFDKKNAGDFISRKLGRRHARAYEKCYHPAMQSDYFRLCYVFAEGGCYVDVDDRYDGSQIKDIFSDGRLKIQPLCYDIETGMMVPPSLFLRPGANAASWIFYFNNNPLIARSDHPLIERALTQATEALNKATMCNFPEIQSTTGPGNLTKSIFDAVTKERDAEQTLVVLGDWENIARTKWELGYRTDVRNWRLSNCQRYPE